MFCTLRADPLVEVIVLDGAVVDLQVWRDGQRLAGVPFGGQGRRGVRLPKQGGRRVGVAGFVGGGAHLLHAEADRAALVEAAGPERSTGLVGVLAVVLRIALEERQGDLIGVVEFVGYTGGREALHSALIHAVDSGLEEMF